MRNQRYNHNPFLSINERETEREKRKAKRKAKKDINRRVAKLIHRIKTTSFEKFLNYENQKLSNLNWELKMLEEEYTEHPANEIINLMLSHAKRQIEVLSNDLSSIASYVTMFDNREENVKKEEQK